jgi:hypothetical protein
MLLQKISACLCASILLVSCDTKQNETETIPETVIEKSKPLESEELDFVLPKFISLARSFQAAGLTYQSDLTNPIANTKNYQLHNHQLLNMGIYSTDLAYCGINDKIQEARNYLIEIQRLAKSAGLDAIYSENEIIQKLEKGLDNQESIEDYIFEIEDKAESYFENNDLRHVAIVQFAGAWIEGMYLGIKNQEIQSNDDLAITLADQMILVETILKGLNSYPKKDAYLEKVHACFKKIDQTYANFPSVKNHTGNNNEAPPILSVKELDQLGKTIVATRMMITNPIKE